jgi:hypothetical protein
MGAAVRCAGFVLALAMTGSALAGAPARPARSETASTASYSQRDLLKNWALSICLAKVATEPGARDDANLAASAYMEFGRQGAEAYEALHKLADQYAARHYTGSVEGEFNTMKCIDLFHSRELNSLATRLAKPAH